MAPSVKHLPCKRKDLSSIPRNHVEKGRSGAGEIAQWLGACTAHPEDLC